MDLKSRDVLVAAAAAFIAWGLLVKWAPILRYFGYAFVAGIVVALTSILAVSFRVRKREDVEETAFRYPAAAAFVAPKTWKEEIVWLSGQADYKKEPLYPSSFLISDGIDGLLDWALRDLVTSWYTNISRSPIFVNEIDRTLRGALAVIRDRTLGTDIVEVAVSRIVPLITAHLKDFYEAERAIRGKHLNRNVTESEELDLAIAGKYRDGKLHPAASLAYSDLKLKQQEHLRKLVVRLLPDIVPENVLRSRAVSVLIKEIVACAVLAPLMQLLSDPDTWNQIMEAYGRTMLQDRKTVRKLRAALDQHASPAPRAQRPSSFPRLAPHDDERKFERFVRAIRQCNNLSEARKFRSEVASQLKRESIEAQDQIYLRRLQTGKHLLDQKVGKLSAVGAASGAGLRQPDPKSGNGQARLGNLSITDVMHDASGLSYFMEYMDRQRLMTLVQFWIVVDGFRNPLEDEMLADDDFAGGQPQWTDADRSDLLQIYEAYLSTPELKVPDNTKAIVKVFIDAGRNATTFEYLQARAAVMRVQSAVLEELQEKHFPNFKHSDLYYKYLTSEDGMAKRFAKPAPKTLKAPSVPSIPESPTKPPPPSRVTSTLSANRVDLRRSAASNSDLKAAAKLADEAPQGRRSLDVNPSAPLFDDDLDTDLLAGSTQSLDRESMNGDFGDGSQDHMVEAMEAALNDIMTDDSTVDMPRDSLFDLPDNTLAKKVSESPRSSGEFSRVETTISEKGREKPNLASLGLVNTSSRIGVFTDDDLFGDEEKFIEDEHVDAEPSEDEKNPDEEIHQAAPGDLGLAEAISALTVDIERLVAQESVVDSLTRKAELTNNVAELRILGKSKSSLQREIRRKELQRQQYIVQESDNSLYGRATVNIKSIMVGKEDDGQEFALYIIEVQRKANEQLSSASWAVARRYSEFHELHHRLRSIYPAVRHLDFPRRRLVMKLQRDFLQKRRLSLEVYLRELLRLPAVCRSRDLRAFLSQQAIISAKDTTKDGERRDIISRIYNSVTDGMDEFLGNVPVLDQLSIAGQNLISAATSQFNSMPPGGVAAASEEESPIHTDEARAELLAFENRDQLEPFVKPICDIFLETFELNRGNNWLRGRAVVVVLHQLLGGTVERKVRDTMRSLVAEEAVVKYINALKGTMWPNGGPLKRDWPPRTEEQKTHSRREASVTLATLIPDLAGNVVGRGNAQAASRRIFATVNNGRLNTHLAFTILDELINVLFPPRR
ncbi:hypothetical protein G7Y79_00013g034910 [Physcia stellaris]|nr:hypothetical protein G7Y79_00013g034910 [Physcia stellaris]